MVRRFKKASASGRRKRSFSWKGLKERFQKKENEGLSHRLEELLAVADGDPLSIGAIMDHLALRSNALLLVFFSLPLCLPVGIPILTTLLGPLLAFVAFFLVLGRRPWIPRRIREREVPYATLEHLIQRTTPWTLRVEKRLHPRLLPLSQEGLVTRIHALYILCLALVISIPLPILFANLVAAVPILLLSLGLLKRDGAFIIAAYVAAIPCIFMYGALAFLGIEGFFHLFDHFRGASL